MDLELGELHRWMSTDFAAKRAKALLSKRQAMRQLDQYRAEPDELETMLEQAGYTSVCTPDDEMEIDGGFTPELIRTCARVLFHKPTTVPLSEDELFIARQEANRIFTLYSRRQTSLDCPPNVFRLIGYTIILDPPFAIDHDFAPWSFGIRDSIRLVIVSSGNLNVDGVSYGFLLNDGTAVIRIDEVSVDGKGRDPS